MDKVPVSIEHTGNTSSVSIPLMLCNEFPEKTSELKTVALCGFGTGLSCGAAIVDLNLTNIYKTFSA